MAETQNEPEMVTWTHELRIRRYGRGHSNIAGWGGQYMGTRGDCSCGWFVRINEAPSKGGRKAVEKAHARHLTDPEGDE
jgi:hypothetical protein